MSAQKTVVPNIAVYYSDATHIGLIYTVLKGKKNIDSTTKFQVTLEYEMTLYLSQEIIIE